LGIDISLFKFNPSTVVFFESAKYDREKNGLKNQIKLIGNIVEIAVFFVYSQIKLLNDGKLHAKFDGEFT
jgi:hypothetical protein